MTLCEFLAGCLGGMFGVVVGHPFDTVKVRQQTSRLKMMECTRLIYKQSGARGFLNGVSFPLVAYGGINSLFFGVYAHILEQLIKPEKCPLEPLVDENGVTYIPEPPVPILEFEAEEQKIRRFHASYSNVLAAGVAAGIVQLVLMNPVEVLKIRQQVQPALPAGKPRPNFIIFAYNHVVRNGVGSLYKGLIPSMMREGPSSGVYMTSYHLGNKITQSLTTTHDNWIHYTGLFTAGGIAGVLSWWAVLPVDVVKSVVQADDPLNPRFKNTTAVVKHIWMTQGYKGFFRGFLPVTLRAFPINGVTFLCYEMFVKLCTLHMIRAQRNH